MSKNLSLMIASGHYIHGQWCSGSGEPFVSINPANGQKIWQGHSAMPDEISQAFEHAQTAFATWRRLDFSTRADYLTRFAKIVEDRKQTLAYRIALESGKPQWEALSEVAAVISKVHLSIKAYESRCPTQRSPTTEATNVLRYKPHGVMVVIGPFNFPVHLSNGHIVPALLAGNTILYKPSELTPASAEIYMSCWHEAGIPAGVLQCLQGGSESAQTLLQCDVQGVLFTGSYQTGVQINQQLATRPEVILTLEMGGNNPIIVDNIQNYSAAVYHTLLSSFITAGQRCSCARRLLIPNHSGGDKFLTQFIQATQTLKIGAFTNTPEPFMGPVIRPSHALAHIAKQERLLHLGGKALLKMSILEENTSFLSPGIIDMTESINPPDEEIFAPLIQIYRYSDFDEAIALANQTRYGLVAGLFSDSVGHYQQFYEQIQAGLINWNRPTTGASSALPFGGIGKSGNHRPSGYFASDYCAYPIASMECNELTLPKNPLPGIF